MFQIQLIRLQCYEGLDAASSIYEWNYQKQMIAIRLAERGSKKITSSKSSSIAKQIFSPEFLLPRPLLATILISNKNASKKKMQQKSQADQLAPPAILLIDEVDRADEEFEGLLLEFLGEFQVTVPEIGTFRAKTAPLVIITSNRTRELGDGLRRRCIYSYVSYPTREREMAIISKKVPDAPRALEDEVVAFVNEIRGQSEIFKKPGVSETIDWTRALISLGAKASGEPLDENLVKDTISVLLKDPQDLRRFDAEKIHEVLSKL